MSLIHIEFKELMKKFRRSQGWLIIKKQEGFWLMVLELRIIQKGGGYMSVRINNDHI